MPAVRFSAVLAGLLAVIPACSDDVSTPVAVSWLEWADSVTGGVPFGVRVRGIGAAAADVRITWRVRGDTVTIEPYSVASASSCLGTCTPPPLLVYDKLLWVSVIQTATPRSVTIRATSGWPALEQPWPLRTFGTVTVSPTVPVQPLMRSVGVASGFQDSFGCFLVIPGPFGVYVSADQTPAWAPGFTGFVYGRTDPVLRSACLDDAYVIQIDSIIP